MARTTDGFNTNTSQPGRTGGGGDTSGGSGGSGGGGGGTGGGVGGSTDGIYSADRISGQVETYNYLGNNPGVPPELTEIILNDGQYYGTYTDKAVAEQNQTYFAYFDGLGGTGPEIIDQTAYFIKYIIDTKGNVVDPAPFFGTSRDQEAGLFNLIDNFEVGKRAIIKQIEYDPTQASYDNLSGTHTITAVGFMENLAVTEIGRNPENYTPTMSFNFTALPYVVGNTTLDYRLFPPANDPAEEPQFTGNTQCRQIAFVYNDFLEPRTIPYSTEKVNGGSWDLDLAGNFTALSGSSQTRTRIKFKISTCVFTATSPTNWQIRLYVYKNNTPIFTSNLFDIPYVGINNGSPGYQEWVTDWYQDYQAGDVFTVKVKLGSSTFTTATPQSQIEDVLGGQQPILGYSFDGQGQSANYVQIFQDTPPNSAGADFPDIIVGTNTAYAPYFTGSYNITSSYTSSGVINPNASYTLLVLSSQLSSIFRNNPIQTINTASQSGIDGMNFNKCTLPFGEIKSGDFIRFEYNKNNVRLITKVDYWRNFVTGSNLPTNLYGDDFIVWKISPPLGTTPTGSVMELNHFNIYRIVNNGSYVILDVPRTDPNTQNGTFTSGILQPEFSSEELVNNYNKIITTLTEKETIN